MRTAGRACLFAAVSWLSVLLLAAGAQEAPKNKIAEQAAKDEEFWFSAAKRRAATAAQFVAAQNPITIAAMRWKSLEELVFAELEFANEFAPPLNPDWLEEIVDGRPLPDLRGKAKDELPRWALPTYNAYCQALIYAFQLPEDAFKKSARENADLKFPHLWNEPKVNRGKVIPVKGRVVRIRKYEAPWPARKEGIRHVFEAWVYGETKNSTPYCLICPTLPDGVPVTEKIRRPASFTGYYLGRFKFRVGPVDESRDIDIPLFVGPTLHVAPEPPDELDDTPFSLVVLIGVVATLFGLVTVIIGISWWFKKGDTAIQAQLSARREQETLAAMESPEHWSQPPEANPPETGIRPSPPAGGA